MPQIHDTKKPVIEPIKKPTENKAKELPLAHWLNLVKGMERQAAEAALKMHRCPPPMMEQVLEVLTKSSSMQKQEKKATPAPAKVEDPPEVQAPAEVEKVKGKTHTPG